VGQLEDGCVTHSEEGSPERGVVSPILSNVVLHDVLDQWFKRDVQPRLKGRSFLIRYADDFGFTDCWGGIRSQPR
jgi:RNA-directed DNA polymerase